MTDEEKLELWAEWMDLSTTVVEDFLGNFQETRTSIASSTLAELERLHPDAGLY